MRQELVAGLVLFIRKSRPGVPLSSASPPVSNCKFFAGEGWQGGRYKQWCRQVLGVSQRGSRDGECSGDDGEDVIVAVMVMAKVVLSVVVVVKTVVQGSWW